MSRKKLLTLRTVRTRQAAKANRQEKIESLTKALGNYKDLRFSICTPIGWGKPQPVPDWLNDAIALTENKIRELRA